MTSRNGSEVTIRSTEGVQYRRNVAHLKKYVPASPVSPDPESDVTDIEFDGQPKVDHTEDVTAPNVPETSSAQQEIAQPAVRLRHSTRVRRRPQHLNDYVGD